MTLDFAKEAFRATPTKQTAGRYLKEASTYESDGMIEDDTFHNIVAEVTYWLTYDRQMA